MSTIEEFEAFFKAHYTNALCLAISIVHDEDVGRDIVSEAFEYLLTHPKSLSESELNNYLFVIVRNVLGTNAPQLKGGNNIYLDPWPRYAKGDMIWYCTQEGSYSINPTKLTAMNNVVESEFIEEPYEADEQIVAMDGLYMSENFAVSNKGNLYVKIGWKSGTMFENPINTFTPDGKPEFRVAPFVGVSYNHPLGNGEYQALFYDKDNRQFVKWNENADNSCCQLLEDPANKLFSFKTGMDMVAMKNSIHTCSITTTTRCMPTSSCRMLCRTLSPWRMRKSPC